MKFLARSFLVSLGIALLLAGLFFNATTAISVDVQLTPSATPSFMERLAEPTLPALPSQADRGAQIYWLHCLPCHGERGQGLTDEFRKTYPPEDEYCWESGCHGKRPYESGFTLPLTIAALIGPGTLQKFADAAILRAYIAAAMPFWKPGNLTEDESWQVTAFLLRENGLWDAQVDLDSGNAQQVPVASPVPALTPAPPPAPPDSAFWTAAILAVLAMAVIGIVFLSRRARP